MLIKYGITSDIIISTGLILCLILNICLGGSIELNTTISAGLIGFLTKAITSSADKDDKEVKENVSNKVE